jgi:hypothetical protein
MEGKAESGFRVKPATKLKPRYLRMRCDSDLLYKLTNDYQKIS